MATRKKNILIFGINYHPELTGIGKYTSEMVNWLVSNGSSCTVVTSYPYYPFWKVQKPYRNLFFKKETFENGKLIVYRCPIYIPRNPTGAKRIVQDFSFFLSSFLVFILLLFKKKFDSLITIAPPFHIGLISLFYRFIKGGHVIYHVQDLQIDAAKSLNMIKNRTLLNILFRIEKYILRNSDVVSTLSEGMIKKIKGKVNREVFEFPNWADIVNFSPFSTFDKYLLKASLGFSSDDYLILYSGNLGEKQGLNIIIDLAFEMRCNHKIKFIICGEGPYKDNLLAQSIQKKLSNVLFYPLQDYSSFNEFLNMADMHLVLQKKDASDLVMPSKLATILSVGGLALVTAMAGTSLYEIVNNNNIGILATPEDCQSIKEKILESINKKNDDICKNARRYAEVNLSLNNLMSEFINKVERAEFDQTVFHFNS